VEGKAMRRDNDDEILEMKKNVVKLGLVGCGNFADCIASAVQKSNNAELITCFDILPKSREEFSKRYGCDQEHSYGDLLKRKDVDGVLVVSPNAFHAEQTELAAGHGKHVFVEKPIANTLADGERMIEACEKAGVVLMIGHLRRRSAGNRKARELIRNGVIGKPVMAEANVSSPGGFELNPNKFRWHGDDSGCPGGMLMTSGIHHVDTFNYLLGPIKSVFSYSNKLYIQAEIDDVTTTVFQFESGVLGYLGASYASQKANWMSIYGTQANLLWTISFPDSPVEKFYHNKDAYTRLVLSEKGKGIRDIPLIPGDPALEEIEEFAHCIQTGERPETDGTGALIALAFVRAAIESARTGKEVTI
jgi:predicted dehydrogenase